jgi:hypothetical protein
MLLPTSRLPLRGATIVEVVVAGVHGGGSSVPDEIVFEVRDSTATRAEPVSLEEAGLREREHLQEWVVANPDVLGEDVLIVTIEYGRWVTQSGSAERDRLDVLGLGNDGRLIVAELKRGAAPDTVDMQALKYAAMASRFDPERLAEAHAAFLKSRDEIVSNAEALERLNNHSQFAIDAETLRSPRVVLLASSFPHSVTSTAVWLSEMGVDISLVQFQAYRIDERVLVSVSTLYPVKDVEDFTVAPTRATRRSSAQPDLPDIEWTAEDYSKLAGVVTNPTVIAALNLCSASPGEWIPLRAVEERAERTWHQARGDLSGLTTMLKHRFDRSNWPFEPGWEAGGPGQIYYRMTVEQAGIWIAAQEEAQSQG